MFQRTSVSYVGFTRLHILHFGTCRADRAAAVAINGCHEVEHGDGSHVSPVCVMFQMRRCLRRQVPCGVGSAPCTDTLHSVQNSPVKDS